MTKLVLTVDITLDLKDEPQDKVLDREFDFGCAITNDAVKDNKITFAEGVQLVRWRTQKVRLAEK